MAIKTLGADLGYLNRLFVEGTVSGLPDDQLLDRFLATRDGAAFEALMARHGPMVLRVCRAVLRNPSDAEDAFQATFLVLVKKARTLRGRANLGGWLHLVAYRVAIQANAAAARRRVQERRAGEMSAMTSSHDLVIPDELLPALHEEIARLPERLRLAVVLCDLQGVPQARAAESLRWSTRSLQRRLADGRERLKARLDRRGLAWGEAVMTAVRLREAGTVIPPAWRGATTRAALGLLNSTVPAGAVSATAQSLTHEVLKTMFLQRLAMSSAALLGAGLMAWAATDALFSRGDGPKAATASATPRAAPVLQSDAATSPNEETGAEQPTAVKHDQGKIGVRNVAITGRIVDLKGRPIPGVAVKVTSIASAKGGDLTPRLEAVRRGEAPRVADRHLEVDRGEHRVKTETDAQGRFRLKGPGAEEVVTLSIEGLTVAHTRLQVVTRPIEPVPARGFPKNYGPGTPTIYGADFTFTAAPGRVVEGVVRDARDRRVMKDVDVWSYEFAGSNISGGMRSLKTRTDGEGRFRLGGFPMGPGNTLLIVPNDDQPYFMREVAIPDSPGLGAVPVEVDLHKGIWIQGKVTDKETGAPVAGASLRYLPFLDNKSARAAPEFQSGGVHGSSHEQRYASKSDGTFRLVGLPGRAIVGAVVYSGKPYRRGAGAESIQGMDEKGRFATYANPITANRYFPNSMKEINPAEGAETVHVDIELDPGAKVQLRVVDPQGKPVTGVKTAGRRGRGEYDNEDQAEFGVMTLQPGEHRLVLLAHEGRKLGRVIQVKKF